MPCDKVNFFCDRSNLTLKLEIIFNHCGEVIL